MATTYPVLRWQIGDVRISRIVEMEGPSPGTFLFAEATPEKLLQHAWLKPHFLTDDGRIIASIHAFVIESQGRVIVVDTCVGNDKPRDVGPWNMRKGRFLEDLAEAGFPRERVDTVLCTHLHVDHVGWNTRLEHGRWLPTFPNARYLIGRKISSKGEEAVITGDLMHHPVQCALPSMASRFDVDPEAARQTRRGFLERYAEKAVLVLGTHFASPTARRVTRNGDAFRF